MRSIEAELISTPTSVLRMREANDLQRNLFRVIRNPHGYLWSFMYRQPEVLAKLGELRAFH